MILALANNKGGVAKTTTAVSLAAGFAHQGKKTLLIDLDSQGSATHSLGITRDEEPSSAEVLLDGHPIRSAIRPTSVERLDVIPGTSALANADLRMAGMIGREQRLKKAIAPINSAYNFIILDCPPSLSLIPVNALVAADTFIVPVVPQFLAFAGLVQLMETVDEIRESMELTIPMLGIVLTMVDRRSKATTEVIEKIRQHYGKMVFDTEIRINTRLAEAPSHGLPIFEYDNASSGAAAYRNLTTEVLRRIKKIK